LIIQDLKKREKERYERGGGRGDTGGGRRLDGGILT